MDAMAAMKQTFFQECEEQLASWRWAFSRSMTATTKQKRSMPCFAPCTRSKAPPARLVATLQPKIADVHGCGARVLAIRGQFTVLIDVGRELGYRSDNADPLAGAALLVVSEGGARNAMLVDAILGQRQVVIKSLEANYQHVPGISAATILGDGRPTCAA
jgi:chemotaxis protein histidine kinase CheA